MIAYGLGRGTEDSLILVVDLGGGTYDVSLVECFEGERHSFQGATLFLMPMLIWTLQM